MTLVNTQLWIYVFYDDPIYNLEAWSAQPCDTILEVN